jgi:acetylornithine deacetylase/succinyl-diaminopimelate desuccinylase-like protein
VKHRHAVHCALLCAALFAATAARSEAPKANAADRQLTRDIFKELIEINTTDSVGNTTLAANAMAKRLLDAGFPKADVTVLGPNDRKGNLIARYRGKPGSKFKPILIITHSDVVEAKREDWTTDPFKFVEKDGYIYGRGAQDMKVSDAIAVADFIRLKREGFVPDRDIILTLTADEENGKSNGVEWLLKNHRDLVEAEYVLNPDGGQVHTDKPVAVEFEATEKMYADYQVTALNAGGHSSLPKPDNAIYHVADALAKLEHFSFPTELNPVTRGFFEAMAKIETGQRAADMRAVLQNPPDLKAVERLSADARYNSTLRTTCVATMLAGGHAANALPQRATANVNCRIFPGHTQEEIRLALAKLFNDPALSVRYQNEEGEVFDHGSARNAMAVPPLRPDVMQALNKTSQTLWPGSTVIPIMEVGASDSVFTMAAGIPSYGICGVAIDRDDSRMHGKDERVRAEALYEGLQFYYLLLKELTAG